MTTSDAPQPPLPPAPPAPPAPPVSPRPATAQARPARRPSLMDTDAWPVEVVSWFVVVFAAVALYSVTVPLDAAVYGVHVALAFGLGLLQAGSLPLALRWPWLAVGAFLAGQIGFQLLGHAPAGAPWPLTVPQIIIVALVVGLLAWRGAIRPALVLWLGALVLPLGLAFLPERGATPEAAIAGLVTSAGVSALTLGAGWFARTTRVRFSAALDEERQRGAAEHERRLVAEERTRIARDLHDIVAHRMSLIQVQATSAPYRLVGLDEPVRTEFAEIAATARAGMAEMREVLTVLRDPDGRVETAPQPGFDELEVLVASVERTGLPLRAKIELPAETAPGGRAVTGQVAYRIVQEALSNVLRHAPGAATTVTLVQVGEATVLTVENGRADAPGDDLDRAPAAGRAGRAGHGLIGMRERARLVGGTIETGPTPQGGFRVHAVLPLSAPLEDS